MREHVFYVIKSGSAKLYLFEQNGLIELEKIAVMGKACIVWQNGNRQYRMIPNHKILHLLAQAVMLNKADRDLLFLDWKDHTLIPINYNLLRHLLCE